MEIARLERWVEMHQPTVYRAAYMILRDADAAADVAQEAFIRAWQARRVADEAGERPWLYRIAVNTALSHLRKRRRETAALERMDRSDVSSDPTDASDTAGLVSEAIDRLPDRLRLAVVCRYLLDMSERDVAKALAIRPGTVKSRLHEARAVLAQDANLAVSGRDR